MVDTATRLINANQRPGLNQLYGHYKDVNSSIYEGVVVRIGLFENYECAVYVSIIGINELIKCEAAIAPGASASTCTGSWSPYFVGDRVLITFLYGDSSRPCIVGRCHGISGTSEYISQEGIPIPQRGSRTPTGRVVRPSPLVLNPDNVNQVGMVSVSVSPMVII